MQAQTSVDPWWAALTVWDLVNAINVLETARLISQVRTGSTAIPLHPRLRDHYIRSPGDSCPCRFLACDSRLTAVG